MLLDACMLTQSRGKFGVNITGNGTATLSDINTCALELTSYIRDPANWVSDSDVSYHFTRFLRNNHPKFKNLSSCAAQYISSSDHKLTLYGSGWVCPLTTGAVVGGTATRQVVTPLFTIGFALALSYIVKLTLATCRR